MEIARVQKTGPHAVQLFRKTCFFAFTPPPCRVAESGDGGRRRGWLARFSACDGAGQFTDLRTMPVLGSSRKLVFASGIAGLRGSHGLCGMVAQHAVPGDIGRLIEAVPEISAVSSPQAAYGAAGE